MFLKRTQESSSRGSKVSTAVMFITLVNLIIKLSYWLFGETYTGSVNFILITRLIPSKDTTSQVNLSFEMSNSSGISKGISSSSIWSSSRFVASENLTVTSPKELISTTPAESLGWMIFTSSFSSSIISFYSAMSIAETLTPMKPPIEIEDSS